MGRADYNESTTDTKKESMEVRGVVYFVGVWESQSVSQEGRMTRGYIGYDIGMNYFGGSNKSTLRLRVREGVRRFLALRMGGIRRCWTISRAASRARRARVEMQGAFSLGRLDHTSPAVAFMQAGTIPFSNERGRVHYPGLCSWEELDRVCMSGRHGWPRGMSIATGIYGMVRV
jgi:hypothetical protein